MQSVYRNLSGPIEHYQDLIFEQTTTFIMDSQVQSGAVGNSRMQSDAVGCSQMQSEAVGSSW